MVGVNVSRALRGNINKFKSGVSSQDMLSNVVQYMGCANYKFPKVFKEYTLEHRLNLAALMEPRLSGNSRSLTRLRLMGDFNSILVVDEKMGGS
ncbi:hypothetical protein V6N13_029763 [Hibiscus sabdariffa]